MLTTREDLLELTENVAAAYNANDPEKVVALFADDGVFNHMDGRVYRGSDEILEVTKSIMSFGRLSFAGEDVFVDEVEQKVLLHWTLTITTDDGSTLVSSGADILHWRDRELVLKSTFFKTEAPKSMAP